jgi:hypothetical protein
MFQFARFQFILGMVVSILLLLMPQYFLVKAEIDRLQIVLPTSAELVYAIARIHFDDPHD